MQRLCRLLEEATQVVKEVMWLFAWSRTVPNASLGRVPRMKHDVHRKGETKAFETLFHAGRL